MSTIQKQSSRLQKVKNEEQRQQDSEMDNAGLPDKDTVPSQAPGKDKKKNLKKDQHHQNNSVSDEDDYGDDDDSDEMSSFIAKDEEVEQELIEEHRRRRKNRSPKHGENREHRHKQPQLEDLDEDDYEVIKENVGIDIKKPKKKRLKKTANLEREQELQNDVASSQNNENSLSVKHEQHQATEQIDTTIKQRRPQVHDQVDDDSDYGDVQSEQRVHRTKQIKQQSFGESRAVKQTQREAEAQMVVDSGNQLEEAFNADEIDDPFCTQADKIIAETDIPERLQVKLTDRLDPSPEEIEVEAKWILDKLISMDQNKYAHLVKQPQVRSKIQKVLRMFRSDQHLDIPMIARYRQYEFKPELDENVIWDIFNLDLEFGKFQRHKEQINDFLKKVMVYNPQFKLYEESLMYASSQSELNNFNALIRFLHSYYNQELTQQVSDQSKKIQPLKRDTVQLARQNKLDEFSRRCMLSVPQFLENLQEKKMIHRPQDPAGQAPVNLAIQYQSDIYNKELKVLHGVCNFAAQELAAQPYIRNLMKNNLRQHGFLATQPTDQGKKDLDIFHPSYRVKNIKEKPLHELCDVTREQGDLYLDILQNEKAGLIKVDIMIIPDREVEFKDMLERHYLPVDEPKKDFNIMRQEVLKNLMEICQKEIVKEIKDEIREEAENFVIKQCQNVYREQLMLGPFSVAEGNEDHQRQEQQPAKKGRKNQEEDIIPDRERLVVMGALMHQADQNGLYQNNTIVTIAVVDKYGELVANQDFMHLLPPRKPRDNNQNDDRNGDMMRPNKPHKTEEEIEHQNDKQKLIELMEWNSVDLVVVAANQLEARNLKQSLSDIVVELKNKATDGDSDGSGRNSPKHGQSAYRKEAFVTWGSVEIPKLFSSSHNSQKLHKDAPQMLKQVISLCRFEQDPMCEMLNLWSPITSENQTLHLSMHPLQKLVNQAKLSEALEQVNIQSVNEIGVDINLLVDHDHMHTMLQFVSGLGPRKAKKYIQRNKASGKKLQSRGQIFKEQYLKRNVYTSTVAFTKIKIPAEENNQTYDILDQTRIHQESYQIAMQIASDSYYQDKQTNQIENYEKHQAVKMVIQSNKNEGTSVLRSLDLKTYYQQLENSGHGHMKILVDMIIKEFTAPFKDPRELRMATKTTFGNQKLFYMLIDESPRVFKKGVIVTATVTKVLDKKAICKLENGLNAIINASDILETQEEKLKDCLDFGHIITGRIDSIDTSDEKKFEVTLHCKHKSLQSHDDYVEDILGIKKLDVPQEDLKNQNFQPDQKKQQVGRFMPRRIAYDKFANISSRRALAELNDKDTGDFVFRPSTRGPDHLTLTWKFFKKVYVHIDIQEQEKQPGATIGSRLLISNDMFANLREIVERYLIPCNRLLREVTSHPKFMEVDGHDELENELKQEKQNDQNRIPYKFTCLPEYPQHVVLMYQPKDKVVKEYIRVKPRGFYFHDKLHQTFIASINWFKENQRTRDYQRHLKRAKSPRVTGAKIPTGPNQAAYPTPGGMNTNQDEWEGVNQNWRSNDDNSNVKNERNAQQSADSGNFNAQPKSYGRGQRSQDQGRQHFVKEEANPRNNDQWNSGPASSANQGWGNDPSDGQSRVHQQPESNSGWGGNASSSNNWGGSGNAMGSNDNRSGQNSKGHGSSANQCYKCNQEGHFARDCPSATQGGGNACYKCNQEGHFAKDCSNADVRPQNNQGGGRSDRPSGCFNCGEQGHMSRECPQPRNERSSRGRGRGRSDGNFGGDGQNSGAQECYRCHQSGHFARECPNAANGDDRGSKGYKRQRRDDGGSNHREGGFDDNNAGATNVQAGWGSSYNTGQGWNSNENPDMQQTNNNPSGGNDWGAVPQQQDQMSQNAWSNPADNNANQGNNSGWGS